MSPPRPAAPKVSPPHRPEPQAPPQQTASSARDHDTPRALVDFVRDQQKKGEKVERYELHAISATTAQFVEDYQRSEGGGAPEQIADLLWARAIDHSENGRDTTAHFCVQTVMVPGEGRPGARKNFVIPMVARLDARPLERPDTEGLLSVGMAALYRSTQLANMLTVENQRQLALTAEKATESAAAAEARYNESLDRLTVAFEKQLAWKDADNERMRVRLEALEGRSAKTIELWEELQTAAHERQLAMIKLVEGEDRKTKVVDFGMKLIGPALLKRYAPALAGSGGAPPAAPTGATPNAATSHAAVFNEPEEKAIYGLLSVLFGRPDLLERIEAALKDTPAHAPFEAMVRTLVDEHVKRSGAAEAEAAAHANGTANGATTNGVPS
jgi:hypothetical protein